MLSARVIPVLVLLSHISFIWGARGSSVQDNSLYLPFEKETIKGKQFGELQRNSKILLSGSDVSRIGDTEDGVHLQQEIRSQVSYSDFGRNRNLTTVIIPATFGVNYKNSVNISTQFLYVYNYAETKNKTTAVRVFISSHDDARSEADIDNYPIMFSARQQEAVVAWTVPLAISESYSYRDVSCTLCPLNREKRRHLQKHQRIVLEVSSESKADVNFIVKAALLQDFELSHNQAKVVTVVTAQPQYFMYMFPPGVDQILLRVTSKTRMCMTVSVQDIKCPVRDLENNINFEGKHQTMSTQAYLFVQRSDFEGLKGFYLVLLTRSNDERCQGDLQWYDVIPANKTTRRAKTVEIHIMSATGTAQYVKATLVVLAILLGFYLLAFLTGFIYSSRGYWKNLLDKIGTEQREDGERSYFNSTPSRTDYGTLVGEDGTVDEPTPKSLDRVLPSSSASSQTSDNNPNLVESNSINEEEIDFLPDVEMEKDVFRNKIALFVSDLSRKKKTKLTKYYNLYIWNLVAMAIFYGLPVVQLVITYQKTLLQSGNEDLCYYNFACSNPLKSYLSAFNNVYSNIGYVLLGILFILIVRSRQVMHTKAVKRYQSVGDRLGIPQHYGVFYAMGFALFMEGVMSGSYHVCPNYSNFQFDTSFMYIIACLCMLRIYQSRHVDISAKAHTAYFSMACIILIALLGVVYGTNILWIFYALVHMLFTLMMSAQLYFLGRWRIGWSFFKRFVLFLYNDCRRCSGPVSPNRFILLVIGNIINWTFALYGAIAQPSDFASYLLAIFIGNLLLYCMFYVAMKILSRERIGWLVVCVILVSLVTWCCALYFFFQHLTSWQLTPSGSREGNRECILFDFYDAHDVWHFLSAFSLFFSFLILLILDDDISMKPRTQIPVF